VIEVEGQDTLRGYHAKRERERAREREREEKNSFREEASCYNKKLTNNSRVNGFYRFANYASTQGDV